MKLEMHSCEFQLENYSKLVLEQMKQDNGSYLKKALISTLLNIHRLLLKSGTLHRKENNLNEFYNFCGEN